jgi:hypothetical protein
MTMSSSEQQYLAVSIFMQMASVISTVLIDSYLLDTLMACGMASARVNELSISNHLDTS